jgi:cGMP-dependent protein kinase
LYKLIDLIHIEKYKDGEEIIKEGQIGEKFYIVKTGQVEVFRKNAYLRTLNSMEYFGERALLTNEVRSATVIAKNNVELYCLDKDSFNKNLSDMMINYLYISLFLHDETVSLNDLLYIKSIGKGNYGSVSLVMNEKTKFPYAIKAINKNHINVEKLHENIQLEKRILLKIDHPFIVKLVKCLKDEKNIYFLMEYLKGKELFDVIRDIGLLNKEQTNFFIASMMVAVNYLHERKIIYRDIKPENIIVEKNGYIKLIDFGTAKEIEDRTKTIIGTPHYMAPEIIMGGGYSFQVDYWSISICMYEFMCGGVPFGEKEEDPMDIYFEIINNQLSFPHKYVSLSKEFKSIMKKMLDKNPIYRLTNFYSIKSHAWFKDFKWDELINLNLKAPYLPNIPYSSFDFDEQSKPKIDNGKQHFQKYVDFIQKRNTDYEIKEKIPKEKLIEFKKWFDKF